MSMLVSVLSCGNVG